MNITELAEFLLTSLYDAAEKEGHEKIFNLNELAEKIGITEYGKIMNAGRILKNRGYLDIYTETFGGGIRAKISGEGCFLVERGGETGIIQQYRRNPEKFLVIDKSTKIYGSISNSNIAVYASNINQNGSSGNYIELISQMIEAIQKDNSFSDLEKNDILKDIETLKIQCDKRSINKAVVGGLLDDLAKFSTISSFILQIKSILFP